MNGCNNVGTNTLATHIEDFIHGIINLVKDDSLISPSFHPMVDGINDSDFSSHGCNCNLFNECPVDPLGNISSSTNILTEILRDPRTLLMSSKVFFTSKSIAPSVRDLRNFSSVLKEFTFAHKLSPVNLIFVGGPRCGKTETAQLVAKM